VKSGRVVRVKVIAVDVDRQRIGLTLRLNDTPQRDQGKGTDRSATSRRGDGNPGRGERPNPVRGKNSDRRPSNQSTGRWRKRCVMPVSDGDRCAYRLTSCLVDAGPVPTTCGTQNKRPSSAAIDGVTKARITKVSATTGDTSPRGPRR
jgi:hypothetical protein